MNHDVTHHSEAARRHHLGRAQRRARIERRRTRTLRTVLIVWTLWTGIVIVANILDAVL